MLTCSIDPTSSLLPPLSNKIHRILSILFPLENWYPVTPSFGHSVSPVNPPPLLGSFVQYLNTKSVSCFPCFPVIILRPDSIKSVHVSVDARCPMPILFFFFFSFFSSLSKLNDRFQMWSELFVMCVQFPCAD